MWKPYRSYDEKARGMIEDNKYMVISTAGKDGNPWGAVVFYAYDQDYNFYFLSAIDSRHIKNISKNPKVALTIFDSASPIGVSDEVQIEGTVEEVDTSKKNIDRVIEVYCDRLFPNSSVPAKERYHPDSYTEPSEFRFYKVTVNTAYTTGIDGRVVIDLLKK